MQVASCIYFASYELHLLSELRVECKLRVGNTKVRVETKIASCLFSFERRPFSSNKRYSKVAIQFATFLWFFHIKSTFRPS